MIRFNLKSALSALLFLLSFHSPSYPQNKNEIFQYSVISSLMEGNFDGDISVAELQKEGDFGLGTLNNLDGELIILDGKFYQVNSEGEVGIVSKERLSPFAVITYFKSDEKKSMNQPLPLKELTKELDKMLQSVNYIYAFRITGTFSYLKTRSVPAQQKPYKKLIEVTKTQPVFEFKNIKGTLAGFRFPSFSDGINVPGYHFHFLSDGENSGGHVLDLKTSEIQVEIAKQNSVEISFPSDSGFQTIDLSKKNTEDINKVEK